MIYILLLALNIFLPLFIVKDNKYWIVSIPLFVSLIIAFIVWRIGSDNHVKFLEDMYWKSSGTKGYGDHDLLDKFNDARNQAFQTNMVFINLVVLQSFLTFVLQILGKKNTLAKIYKWTVWIIGILFFLILLGRIMMGIVPSTGMIG